MYNRVVEQRAGLYDPYKTSSLVMSINAAFHHRYRQRQTSYSTPFVFPSSAQMMAVSAKEFGQPINPMRVSICPGITGAIGDSQIIDHAPYGSVVPQMRRIGRTLKPMPTPISSISRKGRGRIVPVNKDEVRVYECMAEDCRKWFRRSDHLRRHIQSIHTDEKPHTCQIRGCDRSFSRVDKLNQHALVHIPADAAD